MYADVSCNLNIKPFKLCSVVIRCFIRTCCCKGWCKTGEGTKQSDKPGPGDGSSGGDSGEGADPKLDFLDSNP